ncbi:hypothetical protein I302_103930 [Kwoniella bestiolae CBS 10118]|uniref:BTB domain-containing protein n=1 Tax=Kwoniella bestiolae CBS 10118 TaxID=1296100 RepID=A0A1B9G9U4_9TREE|nr:hypothetical protein I302_02635 [Kwoniella bestiolae CBS 10118]OCF27786.1 hypothetical protein I302_02635 [Kwoniella bestiolae CBS 10118]
MSTNNDPSKDGTSSHPIFSKGDVTFSSNQGALFRLDKKTLLKYNVSEILASMLVIPQPAVDGDVQADSETHKPGLNPDPIDIDCTSNALEGFLSILITPIPMLPSSTISDLYTVLKLCHQYECKREYTDKVRQRLSEAAMADSKVWEVLGVASKLDDRILVDYELPKLKTAWKGQIKDMCQTSGQPILVDRSFIFQRPDWQEEFGWSLRHSSGWENAFINFDSDWE